MAFQLSDYISKGLAQFPERGEQVRPEEQTPLPGHDSEGAGSLPNRMKDRDQLWEQQGHTTEKIQGNEGNVYIPVRISETPKVTASLKYKEANSEIK